MDYSNLKFIVAKGIDGLKELLDILKLLKDWMHDNLAALQAAAPGDFDWGGLLSSAGGSLTFGGFDVPPLTVLGGTLFVVGAAVSITHSGPVVPGSPADIDGQFDRVIRIIQEMTDDHKYIAAHPELNNQVFVLQEQDVYGSKTVVRDVGPRSVQTYQVPDYSEPISAAFTITSYYTVGN